MKREIIVRPIAEQEVHKAYHWYEERRIGLGSDFLLCVEGVLEKISWPLNNTLSFIGAYVEP